jgi:hypothetical protein
LETVECSKNNYNKRRKKDMEELKQRLLDVCNESGLPLEAILFVTKDLYRDVEDTLRRVKTGLLMNQQEDNTNETEEKE